MLLPTRYTAIYVRSYSTLLAYLLPQILLITMELLLLWNYSIPFIKFQPMHSAAMPHNIIVALCHGFSPVLNYIFIVKFILYCLLLLAFLAFELFFSLVKN